MKEYKLRINGHDYQVGVGTTTGNFTEVVVNGVKYEVETSGTAVSKPVEPVRASSPAASTPAADKPAVSASRPGRGMAVSSPLPGVMLSVTVSVGEHVKAGQKVAVLEAMKMENDIQAEADGTVTAIFVAKGESVLEGATIMTIS